MAKLTINVNYYNEPDHIGRWIHLANEIDRNNTPCILTIIDDGSQRVPARTQILNRPKCMQLYEVTKDLGFNSHGCRNLAMHVTTTEWNILVDIDRGFMHAAIQQVLSKIDTGDVQKGNYYVFRIADRDERYALHDILVHTDDFWFTAGYDEEFVNDHYGDRLFLDHLAQYAPCTQLNDITIFYHRSGRSTIPSNNVTITTYDNRSRTIYVPARSAEQQDEHVATNQMILERNATRNFTNKKILNFPWHRVF